MLPTFSKHGDGTGSWIDHLDLELDESTQLFDALRLAVGTSVMYLNSIVRYTLPRNFGRATCIRLDVPRFWRGVRTQ